LVTGPAVQTREREVEFTFSVRSETPVSSALVERRRDTRFETLATHGIAGTAPLDRRETTDGTVTFSLPVALERGVNEFRVTAVNAGGTQQLVRSVSFTPPPLQVQIERLGPMTPVRENERLRFGSPLHSSVAELAGRIQWNEQEPPPEFAQFWVNG